ncbi:cytosolic carboxypeptidase-like protein 5 isoform X1 [Rhodnius prolixus]|uniref:cytosolic carboxypeptidase-like protein 5 isoform X1 n=1 Tax=Rhodnius prolixus TaxID=13249 RepID=UPI003D1894E0
MDIECNGFRFNSNFDSGNLGKVEYVGECDYSLEEKTYEFNVWTRQDCAGTEFVNGNRTWFYFGVTGPPEICYIKLNIVMNKQSKMYGQGMAPVYRVLPGQPQWERIKERPTFMGSNGNFYLTFYHQWTEIHKPKTVVYFAFTYPFTYSDLESFLDSLQFSRHNAADICMEPISYEKMKTFSPDDIYFHREVLCNSIEGRNVNLVTITSLHNVTPVREIRLNNLFPDESSPRPYRFNKKVIFLSARVHPGETPSSFVLNGMINYLMTSVDMPANILRKNYVFKIIPMLNPDGVFHGNYRTDTRGTNLNRVYNNPSLIYHPSIYGARALLLYHHFGREILQVSTAPVWDPYIDSTKITKIEDGVSDLSLEKQGIVKSSENLDSKSITAVSNSKNYIGDYQPEKKEDDSLHVPGRYGPEPLESGLFLYIDMHGHASKKGIFMYGNHFKDILSNIECRLLPKLISINSPHFHFDSCNFSERNMFTKDKRDGSSREGAGRVAVYKATGLVRSYTLECNYNTGKKMNSVPPLPHTLDKKTPGTYTNPPKYTPAIYEETGRQVLVSVLDMNNLNPWSRISQSQYRTLNSIKEALRLRVLSEDNLSLHREKNRGFHNKVCRGEARPWKRPKAAGAIAGLNIASSSTMPTHKKLRQAVKRTKTATETQSRLEKKSTVDSSTRRLIPEQRRKKFKPK